jgi:hypothetical protein
VRLYHFTSFYALKNAGRKTASVGVDDVQLSWESDLRPGPDSMRDWDAILSPHVPPPAVWFTSEPEPPFIFNPPMPVRITVELPPNSKRLVRWTDYLNKHLARGWDDSESIKSMKGLPFFYAYFGTVLFRNIRGLDLVK